MMRGLLNLYQYIAPVILTPLGYWLWLRHYEGDHTLTLLVFALPVFYAYILPGIGTNILKVWEFDTRFRLGKFRPHHGFVFGSATAMISLLVIGVPQPEFSLANMLVTGLIVGSVLGFWNWLYDIAALRAGMLKVYNQPYADGLGPEAISTDYAPIFFGGFGFCYGISIRVAEAALPTDPGWTVWALVFLLALGLCLALPTGFYILHSRRTHGHNGCRPVHPKP